MCLQISIYNPWAGDGRKISTAADTHQGVPKLATKPLMMTASTSSRGGAREARTAMRSEPLRA